MEAGLMDGMGAPDCAAEKTAELSDNLRVRPQGVLERRSWFLRRRTVCRAVFALCFLCACLGVLGLVVVYHWPGVNVPVYYFATRPAFVWFGMLAPFLVVGVMAVRPRWFILGCALWLAGFIACEDVLAWVRPFRERARARFEASQMAYRSFTETDGGWAEIADTPLRIVSWNLRAGTLGAAGAVAQLAGLRPDLALMQEFGAGSNEGVTAALKDSAYFRSYHLDRLYGNAILSRFPITRRKKSLLPWNCCIWDVHVGPDRRITCVNVHLSPPALKTQVLRGWKWAKVSKAIVSKRGELETVREMIGAGADGAPMVLAGDFNVPPHYPDLSLVTVGLKETFAEKGFGWGKTAPARMPGVRVDMIFVPSDATVSDAFAAPTRNSDHCPMIAEVSIPVRRQARLEEPAARRDTESGAPKPAS